MLFIVPRKKRALFIISLSICFVLFGCATTQNYGSGIVIKKEMYNVGSKRDLGIIKERTIKTAIPTALVGTVTLGSLAALASMISYGTDTALFVLTGATAGGIIGGVTGIAVGGGAGLIEYGLLSSHEATWQYQVKSLSSSNVFTIKEQETNIPLNTHVKIMEKNGMMFIKKL